jgi:hypothetical protein
MERHPVRDELLARALHPAGLSAGHVRQAALQRGAGGARVLRRPRRRDPVEGVGDRKQSMVIELCERLRLAQLQLRGGADLAGRHREPSLGRVARAAPRRPTAWRRRATWTSRRRAAGMCGWAACLARAWSSEAWEQLGHITLEGAEAIKQIGGALPKQTERGLLGPDELPLLRHLYEVVVLERPVDIAWESFFGAASTPRVPRRADRCDARSGGRSPLARSVM